MSAGTTTAGATVLSRATIVAGCRSARRIRQPARPGDTGGYRRAGFNASW